MAAHEQEEKGVVLLRHRCGRCHRLPRDEPLPIDTGAVRPPGIDQPARGATRQPAQWLRGDPGPGPSVGGGDERLLDRILRRVEFAVTTDKGGEDPRRKLTQQVLDPRFDRQRSPPAVRA